jgi:hypothetical protein
LVEQEEVQQEEAEALLEVGLAEARREGEGASAEVEEAHHVVEEQISQLSEDLQEAAEAGLVEEGDRTDGRCQTNTIVSMGGVLENTYTAGKPTWL